MPKFLTFQKPNVRQFSISGFATALKPNNFDGKNFMVWRAKMVLWLTVMNCYHAAQEKPEQFTLEEEKKFLAADNLFRYVVISALYSKYEKNYISCAKSYGMLLRQSLEFLMLVVSCTFWSSCMTIKWLETVLWSNRLMRYRR